MIKIGICDDERASRKVVGELLRGYFRDKNMECQQTEYGSGKEFLERAETEGRAIWLTEDLPRSFILADSRWGEPVVYISPLSSATLASRGARGGLE